MSTDLQHNQKTEQLNRFVAFAALPSEQKSIRLITTTQAPDPGGGNTVPNNTSQTQCQTILVTVKCG